jgi:ATP-binding protein involved in chromosome partitioning
LSSSSGISPGEPILPGVAHVVAVASAKGGVGKSTVCVNLARGLARSGLRVGVLDADIYGPSLPLLMGVREHPEVVQQTIIPVVHDGISVMSIGLLTEAETPVVWRGPLLAQAVQQFLGQVAWGELDYLLVDLPPGTGDIPLTLSQQVALSGAVIVTTPQKVALEDVERGIAMFERVEVDVIGLVENMSYFLCPQCSERHHIFGTSGVQELGERLDLPLLGSLPLLPDLENSQGAEASSHAVLMEEEFDRIATRVVGEVAKISG